MNGLIWQAIMRNKHGFLMIQALWENITTFTYLVLLKL